MTNARDFADQLAELLRREQAAMADFLIALADFDKSQGWMDLGYRGLFYFLHRHLGLSKGAAHYRMTAAKLVQKFPEVVEPLRDGRLCLTSVVQLAKVLTPENRAEVLPKFFQCSKREAAAVAAALQPDTAAPHRDVITAERPASSAPYTASAPDGAEADAAVPSAPPLVQPVEPDAPPPSLNPKPPRRDAAEPLAGDRFRLHVTVSREFLEKLEAARSAVSHTLPLATAEDLLEAGLDLILERHAKRKGLTKKPRKQGAPGLPGAEHIPAAVKREVWIRDGGRCQWPLETGGICASTEQVQYAHLISRALGGLPTAENIWVLCSFHNILEARQVFGEDWMNRFTRRAAKNGSS